MTTNFLATPICFQKLGLPTYSIFTGRLFSRFIHSGCCYAPEMGTQGGRQHQNRSRKTPLWTIGIVLLVVTVPALTPLIGVGLIRSALLCVSGSNNGPWGSYDPNHMPPPNPVCANGGAWLYAGAPILTLAAIVLIAGSLFVWYQRPKRLLIILSTLLVLLPLPYVALFTATGDWR